MYVYNIYMYIKANLKGKFLSWPRRQVVFYGHYSHSMVSERGLMKARL